jgi:hypothetical protein
MILTRSYIFAAKKVATQVDFKIDIQWYILRIQNFFFYFVRRFLRSSEEQPDIYYKIGVINPNDS